MTSRTHVLDLEAFQTRLKGQGKEYWRSLEELAGDPAFEALLSREFPQSSPESGNGVDRRGFLKFMGASLAFAGLTACSRPVHHIVPYVRQPEDIIPGKPLFFATAMTLGGEALGVLVESHMNRPTKVEGNPEHPASLGATDLFAQASILNLYDPDRSQTVRRLGEISTWNGFLGGMQPALLKMRSKGPAGFRLLTETVVSPTLGQQIRAFLAQYPQVIWHQYEPNSRDNAREGARMAFGNYVNPVYHFEKADLVVSLDSDFLASGPVHVRYTRDFTTRRRVREGTTSMNRLYVVETVLTGTGALADHRLPVKPSEVGQVAVKLAEALGISNSRLPGVPHQHTDWIEAVARDLQKHRGRSLIIAGDGQPAHVHALAHAMNTALGNSGQTVMVTDPIEENPTNQLESIKTLVRDMVSGSVDSLVILGGNPAFNAPADLQFAEAMKKVGFIAHLSAYYDETSERSHFHIPEAHYLETWSDTRAYDGTVSIVQPLIAPLYNGKSAHEVIGALAEEPNETYEVIRTHWKARSGAADFEKFWRRALHDGVVAGSALPQRAQGASLAVATPVEPQQGSALEILFRPDPTIYDGRFANNGWLQETPKPLTKITWDNVALMSASTATRLGVRNEEHVELGLQGRTVKAPVWVMPGHANDSVTVYYGYGRTRGGRVANGTGFNAYAIRSSETFFSGPGLGVARAGGSTRIAATQSHFLLDDRGYQRDIIRSASFAEYQKDPHFAIHHEHQKLKGPSFYKDWPTDKYEWGMAIDTSVCSGCNGCVVACNAENNIPIVGKQQVLDGREMHWLRIDHYHRGSEENPETFHQPMLCQHCENAPCEPVCPVGATSHSPEGINEMTYNRCVGTRYCANNCPYKVRRFNFFEFSDYQTPSLKLMRNPDVTVRSRGVMEKCSYCVQRVNNARIDAEKEGRTIRDGEFTTACAAACPSQAITFGNVADPNSAVSKIKAQPTNYGVLAELNTQPRTTYLANIRNPNPEIKTES